MTIDFGEMPAATVFDYAIVISVPHRGDPKAWTAYGFADFVGRCYRANDGRSIIFEDMTVQEMIDYAGLAGDEDIDEFSPRDFEHEALTAARRYPRDQRLYKYGEWRGGLDEWSPEPIDDFAALCEYEAHDVSGWFIVFSAKECRELYDHLTGPSAPRIGQCGPVRAAEALRREAAILGWMDGDNS